MPAALSSLGFSSLSFLKFHCVAVLGFLVLMPSVFFSLKVKVAQLCPALCNAMDYNAMEFSRPEYCSGSSSLLHGTERRSPAL